MPVIHTFQLRTSDPNKRGAMIAYLLEKARSIDALEFQGDKLKCTFGMSADRTFVNFDHFVQAVQEHLDILAETESLQSQIWRLAQYIMEHIPGEPSRNEGAIDTAIRLLRDLPRTDSEPTPERNGNGLTVGELERLLRSLPLDGEVWLETAPGLSNVAVVASLLGTEDVLLSPRVPLAEES